jgi:pentatricopeptide repeat protein
MPGQIAAEPPAGKLGLKPDIITYTTLVQGLLRAGQIDMAKNTLRTMHESGLEPNERMRK